MGQWRPPADREAGPSRPALTANLPKACRRFIAVADRLGFAPEVSIFPEGTKTASDAADAIGCDVHSIVKSLVFMVDDRPVVVLMAGDRRLDRVRLGEVLGGKARRATLDEVREHTGYAAGGTPPFGHSGDVLLLADESIAEQSTVWAAAGTPSSVFPVTVEQLLNGTRASVVDVASD